MPLSHRRFDSRPPERQSAMPQVVRLVVGLVIVLVAMYFAWQQAQEPPQPAPPPPGQPRRVEIKKIEKSRVDGTASGETTPRENGAEGNEKSPTIAEIKNQKIRNQDGKVVFAGTVDLSETLDRIARGERGSHGNDGSVFQNREKRLPIKPAGYYREWVHPTPDLRGPGPQRIVTGKNGETYYTPDHYETFRRIDGGTREARDE